MKLWLADEATWSRTQSHARAKIVVINQTDSGMPVSLTGVAGSQDEECCTALLGGLWEAGRRVVNRHHFPINLSSHSFRHDIQLHS
jgi:hypothetical protein